jgi:putative membrane protein
MSVGGELHGRLHPLALVVIARRFVGASLIPAVVLLLSMGTRVIVPLLLAALFVGVPLAVLSWRRFSYHVAGGRLELRSGVLSRSVRTIPLERVRGVDVSQPFLHRLLGLARVEVEAAAGGDSKSAELSLPAVSRAEAESLREALVGAARFEGVEQEADAGRLYRASPGLLALGGITSMRYLLAPAAVVGVVLNLADDLPGGVLERATDAALDRAPTDPLGIAAVVAGAVLLVIVGAAAGSLLVDWDFTLSDEGERLSAVRGLLTRRVVSLDRDRIRGADIRDTPARRPLGLVSVTAIAAGLRGRTGGTTLAPVLPASDATALVRAVDAAAPGFETPLTPHPAAARGRRLTRALAAPLVVLAVTLGLRVPWAIAAALVLVVLAVPLALDRYRQLGHRFDGRRLTLREGSLRRRWSELDPSAAVAFDLRSTPGQRRAGLCTLTLHLGQGAGSRRALDLGERQAAGLLAELDPALLRPLLAVGDAEDDLPATVAGQAALEGPAGLREGEDLLDRRT